MTDSMFTLLGSGGAMGVPMLACSCEICLSTNPHDRRMRSAGLLSLPDKEILIDVGPDFRDQALRFGIKHIDGVIITHTHSDHIAGIDDLRAFYFMTKQAMPCLVSRETHQSIQSSHAYLFQERSHGSNITAKLDFQELGAERGEVSFQGVDLKYCSYLQGSMKVNGFRLGDFAYITDIKIFPNSIYEDLKGVKHLVLSTCQSKSSHVHFGIQEAIDFRDKLGAENTYLMHISHHLGHDEGNAALPDGMQMAYDGLQIKFKK